MQTVLLAYKIGRYRKDWRWDFPGGPEDKILCFQCMGAWVWSLNEELGSHMLYSAAKEKNCY